MPQSIIETQNLIMELLEFAKKETDRDKRRELLLLSIELKNHMLALKHRKQDAS